MNKDSTLDSTTQLVKVNKPGKCPGKEAFQRMNYLYQGSNLVVGKSYEVVNTHLNHLVTSIGKKTQQRLDVELKRTICKGCQSLMVAGVTCKVRIKKKKSRWVCFKCGTLKTFDVNHKDYKCWTQKEESNVESLDYSESNKLQS